MIAIASLQHDRKTAKQRADEQFLKMLPAIRRQASLACRHLDAEEREEFLAEAVANTYCAFVRLAEQGKLHLAFATPLTDFAMRQIRAGRRVGGKLNIRDILSRYCQRAKAIHVQRLDRYDPRHHAWREIVVEDRHAGPDHVVMVRLDFAAWLDSLPSRMRRFAEMLAAGAQGKDVARRFEISPGRVSQLRGELRENWCGFQGETAVA